jgi:hypothetical protein
MSKVWSTLKRVPYWLWGVVVILVLASAHAYRRYQRQKRYADLRDEQNRYTHDYIKKMSEIDSIERRKRIAIVQERDRKTVHFNQRREAIDRMAASDAKKLSEEWDKWFSSSPQ